MNECKDCRTAKASSLIAPKGKYVSCPSCKNAYYRGRYQGKEMSATWGPPGREYPVTWVDESK